MPSILQMYPGSSAALQPHTITCPPPCLTVFLSCRESRPTAAVTVVALILVSSD
eukprot:m.39446 g.39446  ORF g.39446 m.39446 type:complete len:54 (-) comp45569_c0_seq1:181-342(-)